MKNENHLENYLKVSDSKALDVLLWILEKRDADNNLHTTLDEVAKACKVTKVTVNRVFQRLYQKEFLVKIRNGQYKVKKV